MRTKYYLQILIWTTILAGCEQILLEEEFQNTPRDNFNALWQEFDHAYGAMHAKKLNWDSLKIVHGNTLANSATNKQLFDAMSGLLNEINDGHSDLTAPGVGYFRSWHRRDKSYYDDNYTQNLGKVGQHHSIIRKDYLNQQYQYISVDGWFFFYGTIERSNQKIGYLCIPTFYLGNFPDQFIQEAVESFQTMDAVIVDLRYNGGGTTEAFVKTLNLFASQPKVFLKSKFRNGPGHNDFSEFFDHRINPNPNCLQNMPVVILVNSFTASSSEHFVLGMKTQEKVITVGDTTCGAFSSVNERILPNGWKYRLGGQVLYTPDGNLLMDENGQYLEGIGLAPDYYIPDQWSSLEKGVDMPLERALIVVKDSLPF